MAVVNTNISSLIGLNNLRLTNLGLRTSLARLSSGLRINWAADDPSGLAIAKGMEAQIGGCRTAIQNGEDEDWELSFTRAGDASFSELFIQLETAADDTTTVLSLSNDARELRTAFNRDTDKVRLLLLLAPS